MDKPVAMLLRHSVRGDLPTDNAGNAVPITDEGRRLAWALGDMLRGRMRRIHTSPVLRCVQTAEALSAGAETNLSILHDRMLGDPGVYVLNGQLAWANWERLGHEGVVLHLVGSSEVLPGMACPDKAARHLVNHMLAAADEPGLHVFVTHDALVMPTAARMLGKTLAKSDWPLFLEAAFFWKSDAGVHIAYRDDERLRAG